MPTDSRAPEPKTTGCSALSPRLRTVCRALGAAPLLVDVGTDHALLPLAWLAEHPQSQALGIDRAQSPLDSARIHRAQSPHGDRLELRLQEGLGTLEPPQGAALSVCGMGGVTIAQILKASVAVQRKAPLHLVLAPNDHAFELRQCLYSLGWTLHNEEACWDRGRYYSILIARPATQHPAPFDPLHLQFGPHLLEQAHPALARWLHAQHARWSAIQNARAQAGSPHAPPEHLAIQEAWTRYFAQHWGPISAPLRIDIPTGPAAQSSIDVRGSGTGSIR